MGKKDRGQNADDSYICCDTSARVKGSSPMAAAKKVPLRSF